MNEDKWLHILENTAIAQIAASVTSTIEQSHMALIQAVSPIVSAIEPYQNLMQTVTAAIQPYHDWSVMNSGFLDMLESAVKTPELLGLQSQIDNGMHVLDSSCQ